VSSKEAYENRLSFNIHFKNMASGGIEQCHPNLRFSGEKNELEH
jgi:hypothetical protein